MMRRLIAITIAAAATLAIVSTPARAQDVISKDAAAELKASFVHDLGTLHEKFLGLAQAFPQDKYTWRPMDGVRSVSEVLVLAAREGYGFIPSGFGGKPGLGDLERASHAPEPEVEHTVQLDLEGGKDPWHG